MPRWRTMAQALAAASLLALAACSSGASEMQATAAPLADPAEDAAALLAAAEAAPSPQARAPLVERLNALGVRLAEDGGTDDPAGDPLAGWRAQHAAVAGAPWRGRALGPAYRRTRVEPGASVVINQVFLAGERAQIAAQVAGPGGTSGGTVAMAISNPRAEPVCTRQLAPRASCNWLPVFTERFAISLQNQTSQPVNVYLVVR